MSFVITGSTYKQATNACEVMITLSNPMLLLELASGLHKLPPLERAGWCFSQVFISAYYSYLQFFTFEA